MVSTESCGSAGEFGASCIIRSGSLRPVPRGHHRVGRRTGLISHRTLTASDSAATGRDDQRLRAHGFGIFRWGRTGSHCGARSWIKAQAEVPGKRANHRAIHLSILRRLRQSPKLRGNFASQRELSALGKALCGSTITAVPRTRRMHEPLVHRHPPGGCAGSNHLRSGRVAARAQASFRRQGGSRASANGRLARQPDRSAFLQPPSENARRSRGFSISPGIWAPVPITMRGHSCCVTDPGGTAGGRSPVLAWPIIRPRCAGRRLTGRRSQAQASWGRVVATIF